jgi:tRNA pseudouridine38-40 synthase
VRLSVGYHGGRYAGWAVQHPDRTAGRPTLQATLEAGLAAVLGSSVRAVAAGRTDAGVHAEAQVVSFETASSVPTRALPELLSHVLPTDIWILEAADVPGDFDARRAARRRWYRYVLWLSRSTPPSWLQGRCLQQPDSLDVSAMRGAATSLVGTHDFSAFTSDIPPGSSTRRTVYAADLLQVEPALLSFEICADAFLTHMVRTLLGSLLWVGQSRWTAAQFVHALRSGDRRLAGPTAPAHGLTLLRIDY